MVFKLKKDIFLANQWNKQLFIDLIGKSLKETRCKVFHTSGDANVLTVKTSLELVQTGETILTADDIDLLVLLCYNANRVTSSCHNQTLVKNSESLEHQRDEKIFERCGSKELRRHHPFERWWRIEISLNRQKCLARKVVQKRLLKLGRKL